MDRKLTLTCLASLSMLSSCNGESAQSLMPDEPEINPAADFEALVNVGNENAQDWFDLAVASRTAGDVGTAGKALDMAAELQFSPARIGVERSRILIVSDAGDAAISELQNLFDAGFTTVTVFTGDPVINSLAGAPAYDELIAAMSIQAYPCDHQEKFREFDFWVGEWDVHLANGTLAGTNKIERAERGCVLIEKWSSATGGTGMSINYLDKATDEWVQIWNASGGSQIDIRGGLTEDGMLLVGKIHYVNNGTTAPFRGLWTPLPDGRVRQFFEQSNDGGETWATWFEAFYTRTR